MRDATVIVTIPTVPARADDLAQTVAQWEACGLRVVVALQDATARPSPAAHWENSRRALTLALDAGAHSHVLFSEDDVDVDVPRFRTWQSDLCTNMALTLYLPGRTHYPHWVRQNIVHGIPQPFGTVPVRNFGDWYGSQALILPRTLAAELVALPAQARGGDIVIRSHLLATERGMLTVVPNLVQHRGGKSVTSARYKPHRSATYGQGAA